MVGLVCRFAAYCCALAVAAQACGAALDRSAPLTQQLVADASDGRLEDFSFLAAALVASGVEDECELAGWLERYADQRAAVLKLAKDSPAVSPKTLHAALHEVILCGRYDRAASDLRRPLTSGDYNCLSAAALYLDLCQACGIETTIRLSRGHVSLVVSAEGRDMIVEPGSPLWQPRRANSPDECRSISEVELLAKFYYNRGVEALKAGQFQSGIQLLETSLAIDPDDNDAHANLAAGLNNWAVTHCRAGQYEEAAAIVLRGRAVDPAFGPLLANEAFIRSKLSGR
jgi:tetratricopeptide (TPR) repeat protein